MKTKKLSEQIGGLCAGVSKSQCDEIATVELLSRNSSIKFVGMNIVVARFAVGISRAQWGKIDFLVKQCKYKLHRVDASKVRDFAMFLNEFGLKVTE